ncbi:MAG: TetR/AcrR family transcriptional regulator [Actinobacteria bacterium]|nr:TetR/AcrR family transcriptional regulator [Actinomycetota bacterium]
MVQAPSRRDRVRAATIEEIKGTARQLLVNEGPEAISLRAIGRAMGMTAPALYRYFGSREDLLQHVCGDIFTEIAADIHAAIGQAAEASGGDMTAKMIAACRAFRSWALAHPPEFGVLFGSPLPGLEALHEDPGPASVVAECAGKFSLEFLTLFYEVWNKHPFPVPADDEIDPGLLAQLVRYRDALGADLPAGAVLIFLRCWVRLYGMVSLEVFGHLHFALDDASALFDYTLAELAALVGLEYPVTGDPVRGAGRSAPPSAGSRPR